MITARKHVSDGATERIVAGCVVIKRSAIGERGEHWRPRLCVGDGCLSEVTQGVECYQASGPAIREWACDYHAAELAARMSRVAHMAPRLTAGSIVALVRAGKYEKASLDALSYLDIQDLPRMSVSRCALVIAALADAGIRGPLRTLTDPPSDAAIHPLEKRAQELEARALELRGQARLERREILAHVDGFTS